VWYGCDRREWDAAVRISIYLAHKFQFLSLFLHLIFCNEPEQGHRDTAGIRYEQNHLSYAPFLLMQPMPSSSTRGFVPSIASSFSSYMLSLLNPQPLLLLEPLVEPVPILEMGRVASGRASRVKFLHEHSNFECRWII
jgi:hypothetical protein